MDGVGSILALTRSQMSMVIPTRRPEHDQTAAFLLGSSGLNLASIMEPKIWLMEAMDGSVTFITCRWRLARFGMSFLPPPG